VLRVQLPDALLHPGFDFFFLEPLVRRLPAVGRLSPRALPSRPGRVVDRRSLMPRQGLCLLQAGPGMVHDNPVEPGGESRLAAEGPDRAPGREKGLLHDVASLVVVPQHAVGDVEHPLLVPLDEYLEGICVTLLTSKDGGGILVIGHPVQRGSHGSRHLGRFFSPRFPVTGMQLSSEKVPGRGFGIQGAPRPVRARSQAVSVITALPSLPSIVVGIRIVLK